jgi:predicted secreted protein
MRPRCLAGLVAFLAATAAHAGNSFTFEAIGFNAAADRFGYWVYGLDAATSLSHAELHVVSPGQDTVVTIPDVKGGESAAREALKVREAKRLGELGLIDTGIEMYEAGSATATSFYNSKPFEVRLSVAPPAAGKPQPVEVVFTHDGQAEVIYAGADGHAYALNHVLRASRGPETMAVVFKLTADKSDAREFRVALADPRPHEVKKEQRPKLHAAPAIGAVTLELSRDAASGDDVLLANGIAAKVSVYGKPGDKCAGKATVSFDVTGDATGPLRPLTAKVRQDVALTFDASGKATFEVSQDFEPFSCREYKVNVSLQCPQAVPAFTQKGLMPCGV